MEARKIKGIVDFCIDAKDADSAFRKEFSVSSRMVGFMTMGGVYPYFELDKDDIDYLYNKYSDLLKKEVAEIADKN